MRSPVRQSPGQSPTPAGSAAPWTVATAASVAALVALALGSGRASAAPSAEKSAPTAKAAPAPAPASSSASAHVGAGDKAPAFALKTIADGQEKTLAALAKGDGKTKGAVIMFLSARCPYVAQARKPLGELHKKFGGKVNFVGINANQNESADEIKTDAATSFPFPMLRDEGSKVADLYAAERTPEVFLIGTDGVVRYHGGVADLDAALTDLVAGRAIAKPDSKAFGCTIKRHS